MWNHLLSEWDKGLRTVNGMRAMLGEKPLTRMGMLWWVLYVWWLKACYPLGWLGIFIGMWMMWETPRLANGGNMMVLGMFLILTSKKLIP